MKNLIQLISIVSMLLISSITWSSPPEIVKANRGESCVEPTDIMRSQHMEFLLHQRDETVIDGERGDKHALQDCVSCHVGKDDQGEILPINAEGQFCESCHSYASVSIDCFACHATKPKSSK